MKNNKKSLILFTITFGAISMIITSILTTINLVSFMNTAINTQGKVIALIEEVGENGNITYTPKISFIDMNNSPHEFSPDYSNNPASFKVNETVKVIYNLSDPSKAKVNDFNDLWSPLFINYFFSILLSIPALYLLVLKFHKKKIQQWLLIKGTRIKAKVISCTRKTETLFWGESPFEIQCTWVNPKNNRTYLFKTENINFDPSNFIKNNEVDVLIDSENPIKYFIDLSFLPKLSK